MEDEVARAIQIAYEPSADSTLKQQAFQYVNQLRTDPRGWQACLALVIKIPRYQQVVRHFSLEIVSNAVQAGLVESHGLGLVKDQLLQYLHNTLGQQETAASSSEPTSPTESNGEIDPPVIHNKIAQTLTYLFCNLYAAGWETCFDDLLALSSSRGGGLKDNAPGVIFYLRVLNSIHDEIGDQLLSRSGPEQSRANMLKDLVRARDIQKIATSWQDILARWGDGHDLIAELCLKAIGKWVSWIDIGLVVNQSLLDLLFRQLLRAQKTGLTSQEELTRAAAIDVFTEITGKKMKSQDKIEMIAFLNLENVIAQLNMCPPLNEHRGGPLYDTDLAETVAKLVNAVVVDIVRVLDTEPSEQVYWQQAEQMLHAFLPLVLRFFADEYDEVCSTVIPAISDILSFLRTAAKNEPASPQRTVMLLPILKAIFAKMRYDETSSWSDEGDQTDEAEFQELRKRLHVLQNTIAAADEQLYIDAVTSLVESTFDKFSRQQIDWRDLDLALHEMLMFADVATKAGGLYQKNKPNSAAAERLLQMMEKMMECNVQAFNHPATQIQYMEICIRYTSFFEHYAQYVQSALQSFLNLVHHDVMKVRTRAWYLFHRFVRQLRGHIGAIAEYVVESLKDLLTIKAEIPDEDGDDASSDDNPSPDAVFTNQLYLFEAIGCMCGAAPVPTDRQAYLLQSIMNPIFTDIEQNLNSAKSSDERATLQVHHDIMALGTLARGISDWIPGTTTPKVPPPLEVRGAFSRVSEATLVTLESLSTSYIVREASRFTFSRLIGVLGSEILSSLPRWIEGLLVQNSTNDELALLLRLLDQIVFGFKAEIFSILNTLLTPFLQRVFAGLSESTSGTDDEIQLAELKREYINFLLVLFNNDLSSVVVSEINQPNFEAVIGTIEYFAKDVEDLPTAKMAFQALSKMCATWGGPDITVQSNGTTPRPVLPGFDRFMITRFSPLCWSLPKSTSFNAKDAQARQALAEAAALQKVIFMKCGQEYVEWLRDNELREMGMNERMMGEYLEALSSLDVKGFRGFFPQFVGRESGAG